MFSLCRGHLERLSATQSADSHSESNVNAGQELALGERSCTLGFYGRCAGSEFIWSWSKMGWTMRIHHEKFAPVKLNGLLWTTNITESEIKTSQQTPKPPKELLVVRVWLRLNYRLWINFIPQHHGQLFVISFIFSHRGHVESQESGKCFELENKLSCSENTE